MCLHSRLAPSGIGEDLGLCMQSSLAPVSMSALSDADRNHYFTFARLQLCCLLLFPMLLTILGFTNLELEMVLNSFLS